MLSRAEAEAYLQGVTVPLKIVAQMHGVTLPTVYAAAKRGEIKAVRIGGRWAALSEPLREKFGFGSHEAGQQAPARAA